VNLWLGQCALHTANKLVAFLEDENIVNDANILENFWLAHAAMASWCSGLAQLFGAYKVLQLGAVGAQLVPVLNVDFQLDKGAGAKLVQFAVIEIIH